MSESQMEFLDKLELFERKLSVMDTLRKLLVGTIVSAFLLGGWVMSIQLQLWMLSHYGSDNFRTYTEAERVRDEAHSATEEALKVRLEGLVKAQADLDRRGTRLEDAVFKERR